MEGKYIVKIPSYYGFTLLPFHKMSLQHRNTKNVGFAFPVYTLLAQLESYEWL